MDSKVRKKKKYACPNPLFVKWLTEWKQEAAGKGLKIQFTYGKALSSLKKYPLPLTTGKEAKMLEYFGDKICSMLDAKLADYRQNKGSLSNSQSSSSSSSSSTVSSNHSSSSRPIKSPISKPIANHVQVRTVKTVNVQRAFSSKIASASIPPVQAADLPVEHHSYKLHPGQFSIILCVDNCEAISGHGKSKKQFLEECKKSGVSFEVRKLHVGDFLWVARDNHNASCELVLDFVIERKRLDDLAHSIKDGRFREQKFRMKNSGVRSPIYLVENCSGAKYLGLPESTLEQAMVNTQIIDGFLVKKTQGIKESVSYLSTMTRMITNKYLSQCLQSCSREFVLKTEAKTNTFMTFNEFNLSSVKNKSLSVKEMFAKHLMQFFGLSVDRAAAIVDCYSTPKQFLQAYDECHNENERIQTLSSIRYGLQKKSIGPALSKSLVQFYA